MDVSTKCMEIGSARTIEGEISRGYIDLVSFPTGGTERAPVMIASGGEGPTLWLTANLHGNEVAGIPVIHRLLTEDLVEELEGTVVGIITLNPSGLRSAERTSHYDSRDPNRLFPDFRKRGSTYMTTQELINNRVFRRIEETADVLIDLHCSNVGSVPFTILDRVITSSDRVSEAEELVSRCESLAEAFGFTTIYGSKKERTLEEDLHRTLSGAALNKAKIPAFTAELGSDYIVESDVVDAAVCGVRNVLRELGMIGGDMEEVGGITKMGREFPVRRTSIESPVSGLLRKRVEPGEIVRQNDPVCEITDSFGRTKYVIEAESDGWVTSFQLGMGVEEGSRVCYFAERAENDDLVDTYES